MSNRHKVIMLCVRFVRTALKIKSSVITVISTVPRIPETVGSSLARVSMIRSKKQSINTVIITVKPMLVGMEVYLVICNGIEV